jgi:hypothetical protein
VHGLLPDGWLVGRPSFDPGRHAWSVTAGSPKYSGRLRSPATITGRGEDELAALTDLVIELRELRAVEQRMAIEAKARTAFLQGAEEHSHTTLGRPLTQDELERVLARYPRNRDR